MKIKAKLIMGIVPLFGMIVLLTAISVIYINKLSKDTKNILVANYSTLDYCRQMLNALNSNPRNGLDVRLFENNLRKQQNNITEPGEKELTDKLSNDFKSLKQTPFDPMLSKAVHSDLTNIMFLNMQAIQRKSSLAEKAADKATLWIGFTGAFCFLIAFTLLVNVPNTVSNPIKELTKSIKEIADQNYSQRVQFEARDEFGELATAFNIMAQKLEEYQTSNLDKLMMEKKRIETLINNLNDPVIGLDEERRILFLNDAALRIAGLTHEGVAGKYAQDVAVNNDLMRSLIQDMFDPMARSIVGKTSPVKIYADGKESYFEKEVIPIKITPTGEKKEKLIGNVIMLQNITSYKELDFAKTNFIATVSHELKTPISSIKMSLQLLENQQTGELNPEQKSLIDNVKDDANRLLNITGELLNMTQVESGTIQLSAMPSDAEEIVNYAINANKSGAEQKQIVLIKSIPESLPKVLADKDKTAWVLTNLVSNAIRYSYDNSSIKVTIETINNRIRFSVADTGQGIAPQYIDRIFDRYFRVPGSKKEGTGLGLSISKEFIEAQGGRISVQSDYGAGSTFTVELPSYVG